MANLITDKQKKAVKFDYLIRLHSVILLIPVSILGVFLLAYIIPYYLSVNLKDMKVAEQFNAVLSVENKENIGENISQVIMQTTDKLKVLEIYNKDNFTPSVYFDKIIANKNKSITLNKLSFGISTQKEKLFLVSGIAKDRDGLVTFIDDLKSKAGFTSVESPISDFATDSNISFSLNVKLNL